MKRGGCNNYVYLNIENFGQKWGGCNNCGLYGILLKPLPSDLPEDLREMASLIKREIILENPNVSFKNIPYYK